MLVVWDDVSTSLDSLLPQSLEKRVYFNIYYVHDWAPIFMSF